MPLAWMSIVDASNSIILASHGLSGMSPIMKEHALCSLTIAPTSPSVVIVPDLSTDPVHASNTFVTTVGVKFYAAAAIMIDDVKIGTLTVLDYETRDDFSADKASVLEEMAAMVADLILSRIAFNQALKTFYIFLTTSIMQYVSTPLEEVNCLMKPLQEIMTLEHHQAEEHSLCATLSNLLVSFSDSLKFLDDTIRSAIKLALLYEQLTSNWTKADYLSSLCLDRSHSACLLGSELESLFFSITQHIHYESASYTGHVLSCRWANSLDTRTEDEGIIPSTTTSILASSTRTSCESSTMTDILRSRSLSNATTTTITAAGSSAAKEVSTDGLVLWAVLYTVLSKYHLIWRRVQMSSGVIHSFGEKIATVVLRFTFHDYKLPTTTAVASNSTKQDTTSQELTTPNERQEMELLRTILTQIGGDVHICEDLSPVTFIVEVSMPGIIAETACANALSSLGMLNLASSSGEIRTMHHTRHGSTLASSVSAISVLPTVPEPLLLPDRSVDLNDHPDLSIRIKPSPKTPLQVRRKLYSPAASGMIQRQCTGDTDSGDEEAVVVYGAGDIDRDSSLSCSDTPVASLRYHSATISKMNESNPGGIPCSSHRVHRILSEYSEHSDVEDQQQYVIVSQSAPNISQPSSNATHGANRSPVMSLSKKSSNRSVRSSRSSGSSVTDAVCQAVQRVRSFFRSDSLRVSPLAPGLDEERG
eukprot:scaffold8015_cov165-Ochromonas_danica.AAC.12